VLNFQKVYDVVMYNHVSFQFHFKLDSWLNSTSTDLNIGVGGFQGRTIQEGDEIEMKRDYTFC
jgi:allophanate hydrolase subunit 2